VVNAASIEILELKDAELDTIAGGDALDGLNLLSHAPTDVPYPLPRRSRGCACRLLPTRAAEALTRIIVDWLGSWPAARPGRGPRLLRGRLHQYQGYIRPHGTVALFLSQQRQRDHSGGRDSPHIARHPVAEFVARPESSLGKG
jgi:hypothetical protein